MKKKLALLGGGHAHLQIMHALAQQRVTGLDVLLIASSRFQCSASLLPGWIAGAYSQAEISIDLVRLTRAAGVRLVLEPIAGIDASRRCIGLTTGKHIEYDALSIDVGSETDTSWLEILGDKLLPVRPIDRFLAGWTKTWDIAKARGAFRLGVIGAGPTGVELALATQYAFRSAGVKGEVVLIGSDAGVLPGLSKSIRARAQRTLELAGIEMHFARGVGSEDGVLLSNGQLVHADQVIAATGARPAIWLRVSKLGVNDKGLVLVDKYHRSVTHPSVFVLGDICINTDAALTQHGYRYGCVGSILLKNIVASLNGSSLQSFTLSKRSLILLSREDGYAIASWGRWSIEGRWAWHLKNLIERRSIKRLHKTTIPKAIGILEQSQ